MRTGRFVLSVLALGLAVSLGGCSLFKPTEPEPPSGVVVIPDYTEPLNTLKTLADAVTSKAGGQSAYEDGLADDVSGQGGFRAFHLPEVVARQPDGSVPPTWDKGLERNFFGSLITQSADEFFMEFEDDVRNSNFQEIDDPDTASLYQKYTILTFDSDGNSTGTFVLGYAYISMRRISSRWQLVLWKDIPGEPMDNNALTFGAKRLGE